MLGKQASNELTDWPSTMTTANKLNRPWFGYSGAWGISLKLNGAFPYKTLIWPTFFLALVLVVVPFVFLTWKGMELTQDVHKMRIQVEALQRQVGSLSELNRMLSDTLGQELQLQSQPQAATDSLPSKPKELKRQEVLNERSFGNYASTLLPSHNNTSELSSDNYRHRRSSTNTVYLSDCPKSKGKKNPAPIFMHLRGDDSGPATPKGFISFWREEKWCNQRSKDITFNETYGGMLVTQPGLYLFYIQVTYLSFNQVSAVNVVVESTSKQSRHSGKRIVATCYISSKETVEQPLTCSTTLVLCLEAQDRVYVDKTNDRDADFDTQASSSFMGLYRLYAADVKKGTSFCPRIT